MKFIWTRSTLIGEGRDLIAWGLNEPCSHFGIEFRDGEIFNSTLSGVEFVSKENFYKHRVKVFEMNYSHARDEKIKKGLRKFEDNKYDWLFFLWLTWSAIKRLIFRIPIPDRIGRHSKNGILCNEAFGLLPKKYHRRIDLDRITTPYKLYSLLRIDRSK